MGGDFCVQKKEVVRTAISCDYAGNQINKILTAELVVHRTNQMKCFLTVPILANLNEALKEISIKGYCINIHRFCVQPSPFRYVFYLAQK